MPKVDFRQFQEWEAQNGDSMTKSHIQRRCAEAGMVVAYHLGARLGMDCVHRRFGGFLAQSKWESQNPESPDKRICNTCQRQLRWSHLPALILEFCVRGEKSALAPLRGSEVGPAC